MKTIKDLEILSEYRFGSVSPGRDKLIRQFINVDDDSLIGRNDSARVFAFFQYNKLTYCDFCILDKKALRQSNGIS